MATKTVQISTRLTEEDAEFLARVVLEGAHTPSDKVRALIAEARRRHDGGRDYRSALARAGELAGPAQAELRAAEHLTGAHSELVRLVADWLPDALAFLASQAAERSAGRPQDPKKTQALLEATERGLADRAFRLVEGIVRLGVTAEAPCYNRSAISERLGPILDLLEVIRAARRAGGVAGR